MSIPYALHAKTADNIVGGPIDHFHLGQDTLGGIVYHIYRDNTGQQHGLIVSKTESMATWQTTASSTGANSTYDGTFNTSQMSNSPSATYVNSLGTGWYLPSVDELTLLHDNRYFANKALSNGGFTILSTETFNGLYWTSTEIDNLNAVHFTMLGGYAEPNFGPYNQDKTNSYFVRAIKAF